MTPILTIRAAAEAPIACDMAAAEDTLAERFAEYRRLFEHALLRRESTGSTTTFRLAARPGVRDWVLDLVRREAACCPFLSYEVAADEGHIVWTISGGLGAAEMAVLDELFGDADSAAPSALLARQLEERGGIPVIVPTTTTSATRSVPTIG